MGTSDQDEDCESMTADERYAALWDRLVSLSAEPDKRERLVRAAAFVVGELLPQLLDEANDSTPASTADSSFGRAVAGDRPGYTAASADGRVADFGGRGDSVALSDRFPSGRALTHIPSEVPLIVRSRLQTDRSIEEMIDLVVDLRATFQSLESRGLLTFETIGDAIGFIVMTFDADVLQREFRHLVGSIVEVARAIVAGLIEEVGDRGLTFGRLQTMTMTADQLSRFLMHLDAASTYSYVLRSVASFEMVSERSERATLVRQAANNFAASLGRHFQERAERPDGSAIRLLQSLSALHSTPTPQQGALRIFEEIGVGVSNAREAGAMCETLSTFSNTPLAFGRDRVASAAMQTLAAPCTEIVNRSDSVPSRFFNAGVSLIRAETSENESLVDRLYLRTMLNGVGLLWSIRFGLPDGRNRMTRGWRDLSDSERDYVFAKRDGLDCVVNLAGSVSTLESEPHASGSVRALARSILESLAEFAEYPDAQRVRVQSSLGAAASEPGSARTFSAEGLAENLRELASQYSGRWSGRGDLQPDIDLFEGDLETWSRWWLSVFGPWIRASLDERLLSELVELSVHSLAEGPEVDALVRRKLEQLDQLDESELPSLPDLSKDARVGPQHATADPLVRGFLELAQ